MESGGSDQDAENALSKLLQMGTVAEYESEFVVLANRVTGISEFLLTSFYISGLKLTLQIELLRARPTTLGEAFSLAHIVEARFEAIEKKDKKHIIDEYIGIDVVNNAIDDVFDIGESNEVNSKFEEYSKNKKSIEEIVVGGREFDGRLGEINLNLSEELADSQSVYSSYHLEGKVIYEGVRSVTAWVAEDARIMLCYVQGSGRRKRKKVLVAVAEDKRTMGVEDRTNIWDPGIKIYFRQHLEGKVILKEWRVIRPCWITIIVYLLCLLG